MTDAELSNAISMGAACISGLAVIASLVAISVSRKATKATKDAELRARFDKLVARREHLKDEINNDKMTMLSIKGLVDQHIGRASSLDNMEEGWIAASRKHFPDDDWYQELDLEVDQQLKHTLIEHQEGVELLSENLGEYYKQSDDMEVLPRQSLDSLRTYNFISAEQEVDAKLMDYKKIKSSVLTILSKLDAIGDVLSHRERLFAEVESELSQRIAKKEHDELEAKNINMMLGLGRRIR